MKLFLPAMAISLLLNSCFDRERPQQQGPHFNAVTEPVTLLDWHKAIAKDYVLDFDPQNTEFEQLTSDESIYQYMGNIDKGLNSKVRSSIVNFKHPFTKSLKAIASSQMDFRKWRQHADLVEAAYLRNDFVFETSEGLFTLWGVSVGEANLANLDHILKRIPNHNLLYQNKQKIIKGLLNGESLIPLDQDAEYTFFAPINAIYPAGSFYMLQQQWEIFSDKEVLIPNLLNDKISTDYEFSDRRNYQLSKRKALVAGKELQDYQSACEIDVFMNDIERSHKSVEKRFIQALAEHKSAIMQDLKWSNNHYNEMAILALGILEVENQNGDNWKYLLKEYINIGGVNLGQAFISWYKNRKKDDIQGEAFYNSRGLTSIKQVEELLKDTPYNYITEDMLIEPEAAAIATLYKLKEKEDVFLYRLWERHPNLREDNWSDYLYYYYWGSAEVVKGTATPYYNQKVRQILNLRDRLIFLEDCSSVE